MIESLPHLNVVLNLTATVLLVRGWLLIRRGCERAHKRTMITAYFVSMLFLTSYVVHKANVENLGFPADDYPRWIAIVYWSMLASHIILAMTVPILATTTIALGLADRRAWHRRWARITLPIWLYVSVTGVLVYVTLYWLFPPRAG